MTPFLSERIADTDARRAAIDAHRDLHAARGDSTAFRAADAEWKALSTRREVLADLLERARGGTVGPEDVDLVTGRLAQPTAGQLERARATIAEAGNEWKNLTKGYRARKVGPFDMYLATRARKAVVDEILSAAVAEVEAERGSKIAVRSFGSSNLTSDYDVSLRGPGAERAVERFNSRFRSRFGRESGTLCDTNVYTDPVYAFLPRDEAFLATVSPTQLDGVRQIVYDQMAMRRHLGSAEAYGRHVERMSRGLPEEMRPLYRDVAATAERGYVESERLLEERVRSLAAQGLDPHSPDTALRAQNELYAEALADIDRMRDELDALRPPGAATGSAEEAARAEEARRALRGRLRDRQGAALYFASEAYQTEGAIRHVVVETQEGGRAVTFETLRGPRTGTLSRGEYIDSFFENRANMYKEVEHARNAAGGFDDPKKALEKATKYFIRQLDAAHEAGLDEVHRMTDLDAPGPLLRDRSGRAAPLAIGDTFLHHVDGLANARGDAARFQQVLDEMAADGITAREAIDTMEAISEQLSLRALRRSELVAVYPHYNRWGRAPIRPYARPVPPR